MVLHKRLVAVKTDPASTLAPFATDGCSGGLSASWQILAGKLPEFRAWHGETPAWEACCVDHDRRYHTGGPRDITPAGSLEARKNADLRLRNCVLAVGLERSHELSAIYGVPTGKIHVLYGAIADAIYDAVRLGGAPCTGLSWRWGYGWPECADHRP